MSDGPHHGTPTHTTARWQPTKILRVIEANRKSSMRTVEVKTDANLAFVKTMGNPEGPHRLACELVTAHMARHLTAPIPDFAVFPVDPSVCAGMLSDRDAQPGPCFASRSLIGRTWGGDVAEFNSVVNVHDITKMVMLDTWALNTDRYSKLSDAVPVVNYGNVFLEAVGPGPGRRLVLLDHGHAITEHGSITKNACSIDRWKCDHTYGLFPAIQHLFRQDVAEICSHYLRSVTKGLAQQWVGAIPKEWEVGEEAGIALADLIFKRAGYVADMIASGWPTRTAPGSPL